MATHETAIDPRDASALCAAADRLRYGGTGPGRDAHPHTGGGGCADADARPAEHLPYEDGQLYAAAYLGYLEPKDLDFFRQTYFGGRELPVHHISDGDFYLIIPRDPNATVRLLRNDMLTQTSSIFYEQPDGSPVRDRLQRQRYFSGRDGRDHGLRRGEGVVFALYLARGRQCGGR